MEMAKSKREKAAVFQVELVPATVPDAKVRLRQAYDLVIQAAARVGDDAKPDEVDNGPRQASDGAGSTSDSPVSSHEEPPSLPPTSHHGVSH